MKKIYLIVACLLAFITLSCKEAKDNTKKPTVDPEQPELPWPGTGGSDINPEKTVVNFEAKGDTIIVKTENEYWTLILHDADGQWIEPTNYTQDTLTESWTKIIALEPIQHMNEDGGFSIRAKKVKIIVFDNMTGKERKRNMLLGKENSGAVINIIQSGN